MVWLPPRRPSLARFINSVILGEESDVDPDGRAASHFDLYLAAMEDVGASTAPARRFVSILRDGADVQAALAAAGASGAAQAFVMHTLRTVQYGGCACEVFCADVPAAEAVGEAAIISAGPTRTFPSVGFLA